MLMMLMSNLGSVGISVTEHGTKFQSLDSSINLQNKHSLQHCAAVHTHCMVCFTGHL